MTVLSGKLKFGISGASYGPRPWQSTSYNNLVWQCRNRVVKGKKCKGYNVYDKLLHYLIHSTTRTLAIKRKVTGTVLEIVLSVTDVSRSETIRQWIRSFGIRDVWEMLSDENDIAVAIREIRVMPDKTLKFKLIVGKTIACPLPKYSPKGGILSLQELRCGNQARAKTQMKTVLL